MSSGLRWVEEQMTSTSPPVPVEFPTRLKEIKTRIQQVQTRGVLAVNAERVRLYWHIGRSIAAGNTRKVGEPPSSHAWRPN